MSRPLEDLTGRSFGRLTLLRRAEDYVFIRRDKAGRPRSIIKRVRWLCLCDPKLGGCGRTTVTMGQALKQGHCRSCGCLRVENGIRIGLLYGPVTKKRKKEESREHG